MKDKSYVQLCSTLFTKRGEDVLGDFSLSLVLLAVVVFVQICSFLQECRVHYPTTKNGSLVPE